MVFLYVLGCLVLLRPSTALPGLNVVSSMTEHEAGVFGLIASNPLQMCPLSSDDTKDVSEINMYWYGPGSTKGCKYAIHEPNKLLAEPEFRLDLDLILLYPGFKSVHEEFAPPFLDAFKDKNVNLIFVDHYAYTKSSFVEFASYQKTVNYIHSIAKAVAEFLAVLYNAGLNVDTVRVVGHSYGGQSIGVLGVKFREITGKSFPHCTGLDPCGPCLNVAPLEYKLNSGDCDYVLCIHSNEGQMGTTNVICDADVFPNGNFSTQPGCGDGDLLKKVNPDMGCSHMRSISLWLESVVKPGNMMAVNCPCWDDFQSNACSSEKVVPVGYATTNDVNGVLIYRTNGESDYGLGADGAKPCKGEDVKPKKEFLSLL